VVGWTGEHDWAGTVPAASLPRRIDPPDGRLVNANNRLVDAAYPYFLGADWEEPFRAERIEAMLEAADELDAIRMAAIQLDQVSGLAEDLRPFLPPAAEAIGERREMLAALAAWDGAMGSERPEPLLFATWQHEFGQWLAGRFLGAAQAGLGATRPGLLRRALALCAGAQTICRDAAAHSLWTAAEALERQHGRDWRAWRWGEAHPALLGHRPFEALPGLRTLFSRLVPVGGDATTVNVATPGKVRDGIDHGSMHGAGFRAIYDLSQPDASLWITATGQSGHVLSPHYGSLAAHWSTGRYLAMSMAPGDHLTAAIGTLRLRPAAQRDR
jgi:penicillin amidase